MKYSLIIPTYNEAPVILSTVHFFMRAFENDLPPGWEIIVVDNGSIDGTAGKLRDLNDARVRVIHLQEKGKGRALRAGFTEAKGEIVGFTDADLSVPPEEIIAAFKWAESHPDSITIGSRLHAESTMPNREWWRTATSQFFNSLSGLILNVHAKDTQCPLKVMTGEPHRVFLATKENTWFADLEFIALLNALNIPIHEVPVTWNEHHYPDRRSKLSTIKDGFKAIIAMFRIRRELNVTLTSLRAVKK